MRDFLSFLVVLALAALQYVACGRAYMEGDRVKLYANKAGPFSNPR